MKGSVIQRATRHRGATPIELKDGKGVTRNFSSTGIFFETDRSLTQGQPIEFMILLDNVDLGRTVRVKCRGEIVRVEESGPKIGVAVAISSYRFEKHRDTESSPMATAGVGERKTKQKQRNAGTCRQNG